MVEVAPVVITLTLNLKDSNLESFKTQYDHFNKVDEVEVSVILV